MAENYYVRPPSGPDIDLLSASFAKFFRNSDGLHGGFPSLHHHHLASNDVITQQPMQPFGSQISTSSAGLPTFGRPPSLSPPSLPPQMMNMNSLNMNSMNHHHHSTSQHGQHGQPHQQLLPPHTVGIPIQGLEILDGLAFLRVQDAGIWAGSYTCSPSFKVFNLQGELFLQANTTKLFCPFDSKMKMVQVKDLNDDCLFQVKFTPSICECDSEEKRCFAVFSPVYENPFGAIMFEAGQLKYSLKVLNALEGETYAVQFLSATDISIKGADGTIVAIVNVQKRHPGESQKYTLTFTEEISSANKALFISLIITLGLVSCEASCSRCICLAPFLVGCFTIFGLTLSSYWGPSNKPNPKP